jgi:hypothetical protein
VGIYPRPASSPGDTGETGAGRAGAAALKAEGVEPEPAATFAGLVVSTVEGALVRTRAAGDHAPLDSAVEGLGQALDALLAASGSQVSLKS